MSEPEPRRSVRSTKGQHKALDHSEQPGPKKRGRKPNKKSEEKQEEPEEEIIRCVCGATEQDEDSGEPWIACDKCAAWQHNVCMGMSVYSEDLDKEYFCELCKPEDHEELLEGVARGEKPWEARRAAYEEEKAGEKKKKPGRRGKGKRNSDPKEESSQTSQKPKASPAPEQSKETKAAAGTKRKSRGVSEEGDAKASQKMRKVSETHSVPVPVPYNPPADIPEKIAELLVSRQPSAKGLARALTQAIGVAEKKHGFVATDGVSTDARAERLALQIERAVHDTHPNIKEYGSQIRTLIFNLKHNSELCDRLLRKTLTPPMLATMSTNEMASAEQQRETAEMKAKAEKQSILTTDEGPRVRRTHKGEEMVENDGFAVPSEDKPSAIRRQSVREAQEPKSQDGDRPPGGVELPAGLELRHSPPEDGLRIETQPSPKTDFDINKVFSSVRSPTVAHQRRPSQPVPVPGGPGVDPEVDRLLRDDREESPPYSPSEETDPNVVWRGMLWMNSVANFQATAKHAGGVNLSATINLPWTTLIPKRLAVAGRIDEQKANEYLCGLRYSTPTDITVASLSPATEAARAEYLTLVDYFMSKKRYGVVGEKGVGNVRDTYLIPVPAGTGNHPEFMLNLEDNFIPTTRTEPMLLVVFVYRNDAAQMEKMYGPNWASQQNAQSPAVPPAGGPAHRAMSMSAPAFSPTSPQGAFPSHTLPADGRTPVQQPTGSRAPHPDPATPTPAAGRGHTGARNVDPAVDAGQRDGEAFARQILGPFITCPTVSFILPQAHRMKPQEWQLIKDIYEREPRARDDLQHLSILIEMASKGQNPLPPPPAPPKTSQTPVPIPQVPHSAAPPPRHPATQSPHPQQAAHAHPAAAPPA